jgi:15-cis-phytoene synthase
MTDDDPASPRPQSREVLDAARAYERDRYLSALLAPTAARDDLMVLAAYLGEIKRVPLMTREALAGEIRLQWWRDALAADGASGHPVADALRDVARRRGLDQSALLAPIEGYGRELYEDGIEDASALDAYADESEGAALRLALAILGQDLRSVQPGALESCARALALTRLALTLPQHLAHGRLPVPAEYLLSTRDPRGCAAGEAREAARAVMDVLALEARGSLMRFRERQEGVPSEAFGAFLPLALSERYLAAALQPGRDVLDEFADISPLSRIWRLWFAHWRGRV